LIDWLIDPGVLLPALLPPAEGEDLPGAPGQVLRRGDRQRARLPALTAHRLQVRLIPGQERAYSDPWRLLEEMHLHAGFVKGISIGTN